MNKKQQGLLNHYEYSFNRYGNRGLYNVYGSCSQAKRNAFDYCRNLQYEKNGYNGTIVSANGWMFTYGFKYTDEAGNEHLMYITKDHDYDFVIDD